MLTWWMFLLFSAFLVIHFLLPQLSTFLQRKKYRSLSIQRKERRKKLKLSFEETVLTYEPSDCGALRRFLPTKMKSPCLFAKKAELWGSVEYDREKGLKENIKNCVPSLNKFVSLVEKKEREGEKGLDGYLIEIRGEQYCHSVSSFAATVRNALSTLGDHDPSGLNTMRLKSISSTSWYFSYNMIPIFVTTFAPCYSQNNARSLHLEKNSSDSCFIMLQPEISFLHHDIGADSPTTNWERPVSIRDKIRVNFSRKQQAYHIPPTLKYPLAASFVNSGNKINHYVPFWDESMYPDECT